MSGHPDREKVRQEIENFKYNPNDGPKESAVEDVVGDIQPVGVKARRATKEAKTSHGSKGFADARTAPGPKGILQEANPSQEPRGYPERRHAHEVNDSKDTNVSPRARASPESRILPDLPNKPGRLLKRKENQAVVSRSGEVQGGKGQKGGKPEIQVEARNRGPGPARYLLPSTVGRNSTDCTKRLSPAYSFGSRSWSFKSDSPGPAYFVDPSLSPRGRENRPSYSFGSRPKTPVRRDVSPGPGAYNTDMMPLWERKAPAYSISPRTKMRSVDQSPSPNIYKLPPTIGTGVPNQRGGVATSIYSRSDHMNFSADLAKTPGPARYGAFHPSLTKRKGPEYTIQGRNFMTGAKGQTPGPGAYEPQKVTVHLEQAPRHAIGVKHSDVVMPTLTMADIS